MIRVFTVFTLFIATLSVHSQCPTEKDIYINSDSELDSLNKAFPLCDSMMSNILLMGITKCGSEIFPNVVHIENLLKFLYTDSLVRIDGFKNLKSVGELGFYDNNALIRVDGFNNLETIDYFLDVRSNDNLEEITGFKNLKHIHEQILIRENPKLATIASFNELRSVDKIRCIKLPELRLVDGFNKLEEVGSKILIHTTWRTRVEGFNALKDKTVIRKDRQYYYECE